VIRHIVLIKSDDKAKVEEVLATLPQLVGHVPGLRAIEVAKDFTGEHRGYEHLFVMNFENRADLTMWGDHAAHAPIRATLRSIAEMIVFDHEVSQ
jgi:heme-degrading monooxygenase HmoA